MTSKLLSGALMVVGVLILSGCMPNAPSTEAQAQYLSDRRVCPPGLHSQTSAVSANGYWCVFN